MTMIDPCRNRTVVTAMSGHQTVLYSNAIPMYGKSAYQLAVQEGFEGTLQEWLASLVGEAVDSDLIVGNWDMRNVSASVYQVTTGSVVENQQLSALPSVDLPYIDNLGPYVSATAELSADISIGVPVLATDLFLFGLHDAASSVIEQVNQIMTGVMPSGLLMSLVSFGAGDYQISVFADSMTNVPSSAIKDGLLNMHINDGVLSIEGVDDFAYNVPNNSMFGVVSLVQGEGAPSTMSIITSGQSAPAILPSDWFNGAVYRVTHGGVYANKTTLAGDFVTVIDDGDDLIVVHADLPIDVSALLADEQAERIAADEAERLARIDADLAEQLARQSALSSLQTSMTAQLQTVANQIAASRTFFILKIVGVNYPNGESVSGADAYYLNQGDWYILNRKDGLVGGAQRYQHVYQWNGDASGFVVVSEAEVHALQNIYEVVFNVRNNLFFGGLYQDSDGWMYSINSALNNPAGYANTLHMLFYDPAKQVTGGYMSLEHVQRLQAVESLAQVNNLNLSDKADVVEVEGIAAQAETNRLALLTKADITALATLTTLVGTKADQSYVNDQIAALVGTDGQVLSAIQSIAEELANAEGILEALDQTVANRVRFDVATQALTSLQKYNARTNIGAEEVGTAAMLVAQVTVASIGAATAAQGAKADTALQSGDVAPVALSGSYTDLANKPTIATTSDGLTEGATNQYFTAARVREAVMTGISFATATAVLATDGLLVAVGKLQAQVSANKSQLLSVRQKTKSKWYPSGLWYGPSYPLTAAAGTGTTVLGRATYMPMHILEDVTFIAIGMNVTTASGTGGTLMMGVFECLSDGSIGNTLFLSGQISAETTGIKEVAINLSFTAGTKIYLGYLAQGATCVCTTALVSGFYSTAGALSPAVAHAVGLYRSSQTTLGATTGIADLSTSIALISLKAA